MNTNDKTLKFKTNINCDVCMAKVAPFLNRAEGISQWRVDTSSSDKVPSAHGNGITEKEIIQKEQEAGFKIDLLNQK